MPTPHISARPGDFADICLLPGDPLRARHVAERHLEGATLVTAIRSMEGYTGTYRGRPVSVMGTGMGIPSASIYATELVREYGVTTLIRIGTCGAVQPGIRPRDVIVVTGAGTDSSANRLRFGGIDFAAVADFDVTRALVEAAAADDVPVRIGTVFSSDHFYHPQPGLVDLARRMGVLAVEMEAAGLFGVAAENGARAAAILTVGDIATAVRELEGRSSADDALSAEERQSSLDQMITITLEAALRLSPERA
jgi:purine-nucleoside phosphorylase